MIRFLILLTCLAAPARAQWLPIPSGTNLELVDIDFPTDSVGFIAGEQGVVLRTNDRGNSWQVIHQSPALHFVSVSFIDEATGFAASGDVYKTTDGGISWVKNLDDSLDVVIDVYFVNDTLGFAGTETGLYRTTNGGQSWNKPVTTGSYSCIHFVSPTTGYFTGGPSPGDPLYRTMDGGSGFQAITNGFLSIKEANHFLNDSVGFLCGWYNPTLVKTTDGGMSWSQLDSVNWPQCWDVYFHDEAHGYYVDNSGGTYKINYTANGGTSWVTQLTGQNNWLHELYFADSLTGFAVGDAGTIYRTTNGGLGTGEIHAASPELFPNPTTGFLTMDLTRFPQGKYEISLYTITGKIVATYHSDPGPLAVDLGFLESGVYLVVITADDLTRYHARVLVM